MDAIFFNRRVRPSVIATVAVRLQYPVLETNVFHELLQTRRSFKVAVWANLFWEKPTRRYRMGSDLTVCLRFTRGRPADPAMHHRLPFIILRS